MQSEFRSQLAAVLPRLMRFAMALTRSRHEAEDLTQAACQRALERADQWRPDSRFDSWMFRIMQTIWLNEIRARGVRQRHRASIGAEGGGEPSSEPNAQQRLMLAQVAEKVFELPVEQRTVLMLVTVEGLTYREAAEVAGVPIGTVMSRLARARLALMKAIGEADGGEADNVVRMAPQ